MSNRFVPSLDALEVREVPAALSFQLPSGITGSGQFTTPDGVDPAEASQALALNDLTVTIAGSSFGNGTYAVSGTADYAYGVFVGVTATVAPSPFVVYDLIDAEVTANYEVALIGYDTADAEVTFTLPDGTVGSISYMIPWDQINWTQPSQTLPLTAFNLNIAGQNFAYGSADFTTPPALRLSNGDFVGLDFAVNTPGTPYLSIAFANGTITVLTGPNQFVSTPAPVPQMPAPKQEVTFNLNPVTTGKDYIIDLTFKDGNGTTIATISVEVGRMDVTDVIGNKLAAEINSGGVFVATYTGSALLIKPAMKGTGRTWGALNYATDTANGIPDPTLAGPSVASAQVVTVTGQLTQPNPSN